VRTQEWIPGRGYVTVDDAFRGYASAQDSSADYANFLRGNPRYSGVLGSQSLPDAIAAMGASGYATDPDYTNKLANISARTAAQAAFLEARRSELMEQGLPLHLAELGARQSALETGWGKHLAGGKNYYGIKAHGKRRDKAKGLIPDVRMASADLGGGSTIEGMNVTGDPMTGLMDMPQQQQQQQQGGLVPNDQSFFGRLTTPDPNTGLAPLQMIGMMLMDNETRQSYAPMAAQGQRAAMARQSAAQKAQEDAQKRAAWMGLMGQGGATGGAQGGSAGAQGLLGGAGVADRLAQWAIANQDPRLLANAMELQQTATKMSPEYVQRMEFEKARGRGYGALGPDVEKARQTTLAAGEAKQKVEAEANLPKIEQSSAVMLSTIDKLLSDEDGMRRSVGPASMLPTLPGSKAADYEANFAQLQGQNFLQAYEQLKGGGQITEVEGLKAEKAITALSLSQSVTAHRQALADLQGVINAALKRARKRAGVKASNKGAAADKPSSDNDPLGLR
jgi:hypothetical protein